MKALTVRNLPPEVAEALRRERSERGVSLNQTVIDLLRQGLGVGVSRSNGVAALAGTWSEEDAADFEAAVAHFEALDDEIWG